MNKIVAIALFSILSITTMYVIFNTYEKQSLEYINQQLDQLKEQKNSKYLEQDDPAVKEILKNSLINDKEHFKQAITLCLVLIVIYLSVLTIYLRRSNK